MKKQFLIILITISSLTVFAQRKLKLSDVSASYTGFQEATGNLNSIDNFIKLTSPSPLLSKDSLVGYYQGASRCGLASNGIGFNFGFATVNQSGKTSKLKWNIGVNYFGQVNDGMFFNKRETYRYDTLTSSATGQQSYVDSVDNKSTFLNFNATELRFNLGARYHTSLKTRVNVYFGLDASFGRLMNSIIEVQKSKYSQISNNYFSSSYGFSTTENVNTIAKPNNSVSAALPIGLEFKLFKRNELLKRVGIFYEFKPGLTYRSNPELTDFTTGSIQNSLGLKLSL